METYNIYMDEAPATADANGEEGWDVEFRVVGHSIDDGDPEAPERPEVVAEPPFPALDAGQRMRIVEIGPVGDVEPAGGVCLL